MEKLCFWNLDNNLDNQLHEQKEVVINKIYAHVPKKNIWKKGKAQNGLSGDNSFTYYIGNHPCHFSTNCPWKAII